MTAVPPAANQAFAASLSAIDWTRPWFLPFAVIGARLAEFVADGVSLHACLNEQAARAGLCNIRGLPLSFVAQEALPAGTAYESHIHATGAVPTRDNLHDFFNALIWLHFPRAKARLNAIQAEVIGCAGVRAGRGGARDAATLFDENAVLFLSADASLEAALRGFEWQELFVRRREDWGRQCVVVPFGHALLEKMVDPYKSVTAHAWPLALPAASARSTLVDDALAISLRAAADAGTLRGGRSFAPLPVMGIPGWCNANADAAYYADTTVFRPGRRQSIAG
ncbi:hypothetical protein LMG31506_03904 [Cupriavidus yeoncheonensis]|uniref:DUF3025 domain-containing protein n=1 Tax=Cupriavidus yeoncheonensis TaxID=1462994 RepID=A0A916IZ90_9BURK|nr:DUF3025 domain-containing protein [Cupriavidus yeoncheonensis]CAG2148899.1 hypothetical protein LMG31506_03904 [Cupriavidus yeoncheonensis]